MVAANFSPQSAIQRPVHADAPQVGDMAPVRRFILRGLAGKLNQAASSGRRSDNPGHRRPLPQIETFCSRVFSLADQASMFRR